MKKLIQYLNEVWGGEHKAYRNHVRKEAEHFAKHAMAKDQDDEVTHLVKSNDHYEKAKVAKGMMKLSPQREASRRLRATGSVRHGKRVVSALNKLKKNGYNGW